MHQRLKCPQGHEWDSAGDEETPGSASLNCPVCAAMPVSTSQVDTRETPRLPVASESPPVKQAGAAGGGPDIPGYELLEPLASGGMGVVYKARQIRLDRLVAVKIIRPEHLSSKNAVARFLREARAAARLAHPNIVGIFDADQAGTTHYLVMEYVDGTDLARVVARHGPLPVSVACRFIRQAALGLQHAHERGLVHRDIKPHNLMVTPKPPPPPAALLELADQFTVKILDMGLVRMPDPPDEEGAASSLTQSGHVLGTPDYIAPEQVDDPSGADIRSDLYSLGCTFYFLLTGRVVFPGTSLIQKFDGHRWGAPRPISELRPEVAAPVLAVVSRLLAKEPDERYQRPIELADALAGLLQIPTAAGSVRGPGKDTGSHRAVKTSTSLPTLKASDSPAAPPAAQPSTPVTLQSRLRLLGHPDEVTAVAFAPDGRTIASAGEDGRLVLWEPHSGEQLGRLPDHPGGACCLTYSPGGRHLVSGGGDGTIRFWDVQSGREIGRFPGHAGDVNGVAFLPDGKRLLSAGKDQSVRLWSVETGREIRRIGGAVVQRHWDAVLCLAGSPDGRLAASGSRDQTVRLWDLDTGKELRCLREHTHPVHSVAFAPDGRFLLSAGGPRPRLWDVAKGAAVRDFAGHEQPVLSVAFAANGERLASAGADQTVRLWDAANGRQLHCFRGHAGPVRGIAFSPDGAQLVSGGADRCICVWALDSVG